MMENTIGLRNDGLVGTWLAVRILENDSSMKLSLPDDRR